MNTCTSLHTRPTPTHSTHTNLDVAVTTKCRSGRRCCKCFSTASLPTPLGPDITNTRAWLGVIWWWCGGDRQSSEMRKMWRLCAQQPPLYYAAGNNTVAGSTRSEEINKQTQRTQTAHTAYCTLTLTMGCVLRGPMLASNSLSVSCTLLSTAASGCCCCCCSGCCCCSCCCCCEGTGCCWSSGPVVAAAAAVVAVEVDFERVPAWWLLQLQRAAACGLLLSSSKLRATGSSVC